MIEVVVGGQYGSEGKGAVAGYLARTRREQDAPVVVRVAGPNAGHTAFDDKGRRWALRQIPVAAVTNPESPLVIAAGSEISMEVLEDEVNRLEEAGHEIRGRLLVDEQATVITAEDHAAETGLITRIGSTGKGVGAARAARALRVAPLFGEVVIEWTKDHDGGWFFGDTAEALRGHIADGRDVIIEGTQGYGLGMHAGFYPKCTSSDCRAVDFLAMAGISPWHTDILVWVVLRTFPIRVAGDSGPLQRETDWHTLDLNPEYTTVTKKERRVGHWDRDLARRAILANGGPGPRVRVALTMFDYWHRTLSNVQGEEGYGRLGVAEWNSIRQVEGEIDAAVALLGTGPNSIIDLRRYNRKGVEVTP